MTERFIFIAAIVAVSILVAFVILSQSAESMSRPISSPPTADRRDYPLGAFKSGTTSGVMSQPQFLGDILTLKPGDGFSFYTDSMNGSVTKGRSDQWELTVYRENNERQSTHYESWGDLAYKLNRYMVSSRYFKVVMKDGTDFYVGDIKEGPIRKMGAGNEYFD